MHRQVGFDAIKKCIIFHTTNNYVWVLYPNEKPLSSPPPLVFWWAVLLISLIFFMFSYYVSLRSEFRVVMSVAISAYKRCSACLYLQWFVGGIIFYLSYLRLFAHSCVVILLYLSPSCVPYVASSLDCPFLIAASVFSNVVQVGYSTPVNWEDTPYPTTGDEMDIPEGEPLVI